MKTVPDVCSLHEPPPYFQEFARKGYDEKKEWLENIKIPYIQGIAQGVYVETSNQVIRGFIEPLIELGIKLNVIVIQRPLRDVALSMWRMNWIPARSPIAAKYGMKPDDKDIIFLYPDFKYWTDYQCCYWACLERRERIKKYSELLEHDNIIAETTTAKMTTRDGFIGLLDVLELPRPDMIRYNEICNLKFNITPCHLQTKWPGGDLDEQESILENIFQINEI